MAAGSGINICMHELEVQGPNEGPRTHTGTARRLTFELVFLYTTEPIYISEAQSPEPRARARRTVLSPSLAFVHMHVPYAYRE